MYRNHKQIFKMESKIEEAKAKKNSGKYNCAQAVACTYCQQFGISEEQMSALTSGYGLGLGNMTGTCGALLGAGAIAGLKSSDRFEAMKTMKRIMEKFHDRNSTTICGELKGVKTGHKLRECIDCVADAAEFLEEEL